jgi:hypothetical protein
MRQASGVGNAPPISANARMPDVFTRLCRKTLSPRDDSEWHWPPGALAIAAGARRRNERRSVGPVVRRLSAPPKRYPRITGERFAVSASGEKLLSTLQLSNKGLEECHGEGEYE